jgi:hypothetical protein
MYALGHEVFFSSTGLHSVSCCNAGLANKRVCDFSNMPIFPASPVVLGSRSDKQESTVLILANIHAKSCCRYCLVKSAHVCIRASLTRI